MIEVLIAILVLAVGVTGAARMHLAGLRTAQHSIRQAAAAQLAGEIADRLRADARLSSGSPIVLMDYQADSEPSAPPPSSCHQTDCSAEEAAGFALWEWRMRVRSEFPGGRIRICRDARPWDRVTRTLSWTCFAPAPGSSAAMVVKIGWPGKDGGVDGRGLSSSLFPPAVAIAVRPFAE